MHIMTKAGRELPATETPGRCYLLVRSGHPGHEVHFRLRRYSVYLPDSSLMSMNMVAATVHRRLMPAGEIFTGHDSRALAASESITRERLSAFPSGPPHLYSQSYLLPETFLEDYHPRSDAPGSRPFLACDPRPPYICPSNSPPTMTTEVFVKDGIEIRRLKSDDCVLEDGWTQYTHINKVRSP